MYMWTHHRLARYSNISVRQRRYNHYQTLGIARGASVKQIKAKFYELSKVLHPDRNRSKSQTEQRDAKKKFQKVKDAYEVLSDDEKRRIYDGTLSQSSFTSSTRDARRHSGHSRTTRTTRYARTQASSTFYKSRVPEDHPLSPKPRSGSDHDVPHFDFDAHLRQQEIFQMHRHQRHVQKDEQEARENYEKNENAKYSWFSTTFIAGSVCFLYYVSYK